MVIITTATRGLLWYDHKYRSFWATGFYDFLLLSFFLGGQSITRPLTVWNKVHQSICRAYFLLFFCCKGKSFFVLWVSDGCPTKICEIITCWDTMYGPVFNLHCLIYLKEPCQNIVDCQWVTVIVCVPEREIMPQWVWEISEVVINPSWSYIL